MKGLCPVTLQVDTIGSFQLKRRCATFGCDETVATIAHDIGVVELTILLDQMQSGNKGMQNWPRQGTAEKEQLVQKDEN